MSPDDTLDARAYSHPALGERNVVRLVSTTLGAAEDLALEFLGFQLVSVDESVARGRRQALGFPAWALANDPANGAYALAVVKDMERLARLARSKPGAARDGFEQLGQQLARTVPHFLPTFYEQVGRTYIESDQPNQAATMFSRAREAERVYGLAVDEDRRREVFVEFALAGALSSKAIDELADQLGGEHAGARGLSGAARVVRPAHAGRCTTVGQHGRTTDQDGQVGRAGRQRGSQPAVAAADRRAGHVAGGGGILEGVSGPLLALARESPVLRGKLLNLFPAPQPRAPKFVDWWLDLLSRCGAEDGLTQPTGSVPAEAEPVGGPAAWLSRLVARQNQGWSSALPATLPSLLERMAARLQMDGVAVDLIGPRAWWADVDLIDLALALRIPLAPPTEHAMLSVTGYGSRQPERDLLHIAQDPVFGPRVAEALEFNLGQGHSHADRLPRSAGVQRLLHAWLDGCADQFEHGGLAQIEYALARLETATSAATLALNPAARARIAAADLANAVARTLRGGIVDEFGWPALEAAHAQLQPGPNGKA